MMLRILCTRCCHWHRCIEARSIAAAHSRPALAALTQRRAHHYGATSGGHEPGSKAFNAHYVKQFLRWDIDDWEARQAMNDLAGMDLVPHPDVIAAGLRACRQLNDLALAIRWLEVCKNKCGNEVKVLFPQLMRRIKPTMDELGVPTLEELQFDKPQLALESVDDM